MQDRLSTMWCFLTCLYTRVSMLHLHICYTGMLVKKNRNKIIWSEVSLVNKYVVIRIEWHNKLTTNDLSWALFPVTFPPSSLKVFWGQKFSWRPKALLCVMQFSMYIKAMNVITGQALLWGMNYFPRFGPLRTFRPVSSLFQPIWWTIWTKTI